MLDIRKLNPDRIQPIRDRVLVKILTPKPSGVIVLVSFQKPTQHEALIVAVGPGRWIEGEFIRTTVKPGQRVLIGPYDDWERKNLMLIQEADIRGVFTDDEKAA